YTLSSLMSPDDSRPRKRWSPTAFARPEKGVLHHVPGRSSRLHVVDAEQRLLVRPCAYRLEPGSTGHRVKALDRVLVRILGDDELAAPERDASPGNRDDLVREAHQPHLDAALVLVVHGLVTERADVEIGAELAVQPVQHVQVELGRDP